MISGVVYTALRGLVADRCYPNAFPQETIGGPSTQVPPLVVPTWPAIRYQLVSSDNAPDITGTDTVATDDTRVQVDGVAKTYGGMITLRDQIIVAMQTTVPPCFRDGMFESKDLETETHRCTLDFIFFASSP